MASISKPTASDAHPESMDFLSQAWCNFAVKTLQPDRLHDHQSIIIRHHPLEKYEHQPTPPFLKMEKSTKLDDAADFKPTPPWESNDFKSWIWMQQAMHPELNYNSYFRKKWQLPWKMVSFKDISFKKWLKEMRLRRKEEERLQRGEVHAAVSVAGVAAALAAIAAENSEKDESRTTKEAAVAAAAGLVAVQCAKVAAAMGAKKEQLSGAIGSAMSGTSASDILTLTAAATTSLRGAATLKATSGCRNILSGSSPILPIQDNNDFPFEFNNCRSMLAKGNELTLETPDGECKVRLVSVVLGREAKVILKLRKLNLFKNKKESIVLDLHAELYRDSEADDSETCYLLVLTTNLGTVKLDMGDDYHRHKTWAATINHMLVLSTSSRKYKLQFYRK